MALVGEAFLSASVEFLLEKVTSREFQDFFANKMLNVSLLNELKITLLALNIVLDDAEEKQITKPLVRKWLDELKDAVFDAEDLLDEIDTHCQRCKVEAQSQNVTNQVWRFLSSPFNQFHKDINSKMEDMSRRLSHFSNQRDILDLKTVTSRVSRRTPTSSVVNESLMVGRDQDKEKLLKMLLSDEDANGNNIGVVTILGMGGVGKTTLAQLLYNHKEVQDHFDLKAWVCVSENFDVIKVTKTLLESATSKTYDRRDPDFLRVELKQNLRDKKFLFVLDDLWNDDYGDWNDLIIPFTSGKNGSRIVVTTRQRKVAEASHTFSIHTLDPLVDEECWSILAKHAFGNDGLNKYQNLEAIGRKIARKCGGLPIAAKTLGGLLRSKVDAHEWNRILNSNLWDLTNDKVLPALHLSYLYLPAALKRCFAYCSIFPKDYELDRKKLVLLWMAEGLVQQSQGGKRMEDVGDEYFVELVSRSLIQQFNYDSGEQFVMHDLVHDLATIVSGNSCFRYEDGKIPENVRHLSYQMSQYDTFQKFETFNGLKGMRSFLALPNFKVYGCCLNTKVLNDLLPELGSLRVLCLSGYSNITELPNSISNLVHLRYLDLSKTAIKRLPEEICMLYNLQTLILSNCYGLIEFPAKIGKLVNLRHLDIIGTMLKEMPQISELQNLQTLIGFVVKEMPPLQICSSQIFQSWTKFIVGRQHDGLRVRELREFPHIQGTVCIEGLGNVVDSMDALEVNLRKKDHIEKLQLDWGWGNNTEDSLIAKDVLEQLQPSTNLRELTLLSYGGTSFPSCLGDPTFSNMVLLEIIYCDYCWSLPPLGQLPALKQLKIWGLQSVRIIDTDFYGSGCSSFQSFPSLEELEIEDMPNWEEWLQLEGEDVRFPFPSLKYLKLNGCPKLKGYLPHHLPSWLAISIIRCPQLEVKELSSLHLISSVESLIIDKGGPHLMSILDHLSVKRLSISTCDSVPCLPQMTLSSNCLRHLSLCNIQSLVSFPADGLPTSLQSLEIHYCKKLEFLPHETWCNYTSLETLHIRKSCRHSLTCFPLGCFPALKELSISGCRNLRSLSILESSAHTESLSLLEILRIRSCNFLKSFPQGVLPTHNLRELEVCYCATLESLPKRIDNLTSLHSMKLSGLQNLASFPQGNLPRNLKRIYVGGDGIINTLLKDRLLPTSLQQLHIGSCSSLLSFPNGLQHVTSLKELHITRNMNLKSLPDGLQHLTSLRELYIKYCQCLESLPKDRLPSSLSLLSILECPKLKDQDWSKLAHIPVIEKDGELII